MRLQQNSLGFLLADVSRLMRCAFMQRMNKSDLAQARVLVYVSLHEGASQVDLADFLEEQPVSLRLTAIEQVARTVRAEALRGPSEEQTQLLLDALQQRRDNLCPR